MRASHTAVVERDVWWTGSFATEPYEAGWASQAIVFVRTLESRGLDVPAQGRVQISPDGMAWCDEGTTVPIAPAPGLAYCRVRHFGGWLRITGTLPQGAAARVIVYLVLKA
jgi:hypothetical protein